MKTVLVTGADGFIGRNLTTALERYNQCEIEILSFTSCDSLEKLASQVKRSDLIYHLAGANRPADPIDFQTINTGLTGSLVKILEQTGRSIPVVFSSSTQVSRDNPYGRSKLAAEDTLNDHHRRTGNPVAIYRIPNVFGKWSRANYNTVVATFCHNVARDQDIQINDPDAEMTLVYIDEVVRCFLRHLDIDNPSSGSCDVEETFRISIGELARRIRSFRSIRQSLEIPDLTNSLTRYLYSTYLSFLPQDNFAYPVELRQDDRGSLFELLKSKSFGQLFVSTTKPGITRGNHYHDTKVEKFCLIRGSAIVRLRQLRSESVLEYAVDDQNIRVVDVPPGYTHSIENTGTHEMIVLFWANEIFDADQPDTYWVPVIK